MSDCGQFWSCNVSRALSMSLFCDLVVKDDENQLPNNDISKIAKYMRQLNTLLVMKMHQDNRREVGRSKNSRNRKKQSHEHISLPMAKTDVTIPMTINLRSSLVLGLVIRLASMTGSFVLSLEMVNTFMMMIAITAAKAMAEENNISREVTRTSESPGGWGLPPPVVMTNTWLMVVTYQHESFSTTNTVVNLM